MRGIDLRPKATFEAPPELWTPAKRKLRVPGMLHGLGALVLLRHMLAAQGVSSANADDILDALCNNTAFTGPATLFMKLHIGVPGAAGTGNPAGETTRKALSFGAASAGSIANDSALTWTGYGASETPTHFSAWDNVSAGTFQFSGTVTSSAISSGNTFTIGVGDVVGTLPPAS